MSKLPYISTAFNRKICIGALFIFAVSAVFAKLHYANWEISLFNSIYGWPSGWNTLMYSFTLLGSWMMVFAISLGLALYRKIKLSFAVLVVGFATLVVSELFKVIVGRPRPFVALHDVISKDHLALGMGFPSGHTATATAVGLVLLPIIPRSMRWLVPVWISVVALSRVYLGVHWPLDVIGGFALGVTVSQLYLLFSPKIEKLWLQKKKSL